MIVQKLCDIECKRREIIFEVSLSELRPSHRMWIGRHYMGAALLHGKWLACRYITEKNHESRLIGYRMIGP